MEKANNLWIHCSTITFENIRKLIVEHNDSKMFECIENRDRVGKVVIETIKVKGKNTR